mmetsp:Transcript_33182/g.53404  ORF Transcript_33182/g.53404 Transcript_33182/m.53404 type:complete len:321 (+) Transcript_33182:328-1290(+)
MHNDATGTRILFVFELWVLTAFLHNISQLVSSLAPGARGSFYNVFQAILLGLQQLPVAADLQLQGQLGVLQHLQFPDHLLQTVLQPGDPLHVLVILTVVFSLHVRHLALQSYDLVAQFGILSLQLGKTRHHVSHSALEFLGLLLGLQSLHVVSVDAGLELSQLGLHSALAVQADLVELVVVLLLEFADGLGHLALPDVPHLGSLVSVDQSLQFLDLRIGHVKSEGQVLLHSLGLDLGFNTLPCFFVQVRSEASNVVLQPLVGGPQLADFVLQPSDPAPQGGDFPLVLPDLVVQAVQFIPKFSTLFITGKTFSLLIVQSIL